MHRVNSLAVNCADPCILASIIISKAEACDDTDQMADFRGQANNGDQCFQETVSKPCTTSMKFDPLNIGDNPQVMRVAIREEMVR